MKKLILTGLSFLFAITLTFAQEINPETKAKEVIVELTEKLTLNEDQQKAIYDIVLEKVKAKQTLQADTTLSPETKKEQIESAKKDANTKIAALLTEEQNAAYVKYIEEKQGKKETTADTKTEE